MELIVEIMTIFVFRSSRQHLSPIDRFYCCHQPVFSTKEDIFRSLAHLDISIVLDEDPIQVPHKLFRNQHASFVVLKTGEISKKERIQTSF